MNAIKNYFATLSWRGWAHVLIIALLGFALVKSCAQNISDEQRIKELTQVKPKPVTATTKEAEKIAEKVTKEGKTVTTFKEAERIIKVIENNTKADSIARLAEIDRKKVTALTVINGTLSKENTDLKRELVLSANGKTDTFFRYSDQWLSAEGYRKNDTVFTLRNIRTDVSINKIDHTRKKYWLVGRNEELTTLYYNSPYAKVNGLSTYKLQQKDPFLNIDLKVEGKYFPERNNILIGPKLRIGLGRVGINGGYYLNPRGTLGNGVWYGVDWKVY